MRGPLWTSNARAPSVGWSRVGGAALRASSHPGHAGLSWGLWSGRDSNSTAVRLAHEAATVAGRMGRPAAGDPPAEDRRAQHGAFEAGAAVDVGERPWTIPRRCAARPRPRVPRARACPCPGRERSAVGEAAGRQTSLNAPAHAAASVALEVLKLLGIEAPRACHPRWDAPRPRPASRSPPHSYFVGRPGLVGCLRTGKAHISTGHNAPSPLKASRRSVL